MEDHVRNAQSSFLLVKNIDWFYNKKNQVCTSKQKLLLRGMWKWEEFSWNLHEEKNEI